MKNISKSLLTLLVFVLLTVKGNASTPPDSTVKVIDKASAAYLIEEGRTMFQEGKIKDALIKFRQASVRDENSWKAPYWISQCHYQLNNYGYALKYAQRAKMKGGEKVDNEMFYNLGRIYHRLSKLDSAIINYNIALERLSKRRSKELWIEQLIEECKFAKEALKTPAKFKRERVRGDINSGYDDYNIVLLDGGKSAYFTSRRSNTTGGNLNPDDQLYFEDVYKATWNPETKMWENVTNDLGRLNSEGFDAINYVSPDTLYAIMTLNNSATDAKKRTKGSDICELKKNNKGTWNSPKIIKNKSINTSYFEGSATLTADGNTMYFVTDRKGEKSSTDIYKVEKNGKKWGTAKPLPMTINTIGRETTPYITPDGRYLFFSSNGHKNGMGGLDVYVVENKGDEWGTPVNLGPGINTVNNDSHFVYSEELKKAFITGYEIVGDKSSLDLYEIDMKDFTFPTE